MVACRETALDAHTSRKSMRTRLSSGWVDMEGHPGSLRRRRSSKKRREASQHSVMAIKKTAGSMCVYIPSICGQASKLLRPHEMGTGHDRATGASRDGKGRRCREDTSQGEPVSRGQSAGHIDCNQVTPPPRCPGSPSGQRSRPRCPRHAHAHSPTRPRSPRTSRSWTLERRPRHPAGGVWAKLRAVQARGASMSHLRILVRVN